MKTLRKVVICQVSRIMLIVMMLQIFLPASQAYALTSGPSQPEFQGFQPVGTNDMVNLFTGDFSYNIPLMELPGPNGGYPFNLSYAAGIGMEEEASWVGLGWSMYPGAISRNMRGLPDDFKGDEITNQNDMKDQVTVGASFSPAPTFEAMGFPLFEGLSFDVYYNNYNGLGMKTAFSLSRYIQRLSPLLENVSADFDFDTQNGFGLSGQMGRNVNFSFSANEGLSNFGINYHKGLFTSNVASIRPNTTRENNSLKKNNIGSLGRGLNISVAIGTSYNLLNKGHIPSVGLEMEGRSDTHSFGTGFSVSGTYIGFDLGAYRTSNSIRRKGQDVNVPAYGYFYYHEGMNDNTENVFDFNREKDGIINKTQTHLASTQLTYDIYQVHSQGIISSFRPYRADVGTVMDRTSGSVNNSVFTASQLGLGSTITVGLNLGGGEDYTTSGRWSDHTFPLFKNNSPEQNNVYFATMGEQNISVNTDNTDENPESIIDHAPMAFNLRKSALNKPYNTEVSAQDIKKLPTKRPSTNIVHLTNAQLRNGGLKEFTYGTDNLSLYGGQQLAPHKKDHHIGAFIVTKTDGTRYVYALPVYNLEHEEYTFSTNENPGSRTVPVRAEGGTIKNHKDAGRDEFFHKKKIPAYVHSYLLTAILGPDYVDVNNDGPDKHDLGYWVSFSYTKSETDYQWRNPFYGANYTAGLLGTPDDDRGSFVYGRRENWILTKAQTKSHKIEFNMHENTTGKRQDARGAFGRFQNGPGDPGSENAAYSPRLDEMVLYAISPSGQEVKIKSVHFEYSNELCPGVHNNFQNSSGKLTLKGLYFKYGTSERKVGRYAFSYNMTNNPEYSLYAFDNWGNYKAAPTDADKKRNVDFPYLPQQSDPQIKSRYDQYASAWSLTGVTLPSGGDIKIQYEADDYAYVQHRPAMQLHPVSGTGQDIAHHTQNYFGDQLQGPDHKIFFRLDPQPSDDLVNTREKQMALLDKYVDWESGELYFRAKLLLKDGVFDYVSGYARLTQSNSPEHHGLVKHDGTWYGYISVLGEKDKGIHQVAYHPIAVAAWHHLRSNLPKLARNMDNYMGSNILSIARGFANILNDLSTFLTGFFKVAASNKWGTTFASGSTWIRLKNPQQKKVGGGIRVKQIVLNDQWMRNAVQSHVYGQVYDYTTIENGNVISSGVVSYEPANGGEEIPFRYPRRATNVHPMLTKQNMFFEYPVNEGYFPAPMVGYSKVTVKSLATAVQERQPGISDDIAAKFLSSTVAQGFYPTTGQTVHEFYTAKDFPTLTYETPIKQYGFHNIPIIVPIYPIGSVTWRSLGASQGYSIVSNDMHGKPKSITHFILDKTGKVIDVPVSYTKYHYKHKTITYQLPGSRISSNVKVLDNVVDAQVIRRSGQQSVRSVLLGVETERFFDMRENTVKSKNLRFDNNFAISFEIGIPIITWTGYPIYDYTEQSSRIVTSNKIIYRTGILEKMEVFDGESTVSTENLLWDGLTGEVIKTSVTNDFANRTGKVSSPIISYHIPAYYHYEGMGLASMNSNLSFDLSIESRESLFGPGYYKIIVPAALQQCIFPGDEYLLSSKTENPVFCRAVYEGKSHAGEHVIYIFSNLSNMQTALSSSPNINAFIYRSGKRNILSAKAGSISGLDQNLPVQVVPVPEDAKKTIKQFKLIDP